MDRARAIPKFQGDEAEARPLIVADRCASIRERNVYAYVRGDTRAITARLVET